MATVKTVVRTNRKNAEVNVRFRVSDGRNIQLFHSSEIKVKAEVWDGKNDCIKARAIFDTEKRNQINRSVVARKQLLFDLYEANKSKIEITSEVLEQLVNQKLYPEKYQKPQENFFDLMNLYLEKRKLSEVRKKNFRVLIRALKRYELFYQIRNKPEFKLSIDKVNSNTIEIEKRIKERNDEITEKKIENYKLYNKAKEAFEKSEDDSDKLLAETFSNWVLWNKCEEFYYRGLINKFDLAKKGVPLKDRFGVRFFARIIMEKEQRDMFKSTKDRMNELYRIYCPNSNVIKEEKQSKTINLQVEKDFISYLHHDNKDALMEKLHELLDNEKGKVVAITIKALENLGFISVISNRSKLYKAMKNEFGEIGTPQSIAIIFFFFFIDIYQSTLIFINK